MSQYPISEDDLHTFVDGLLPRLRHDEVVAWLNDHPEDAAKVVSYRDQRRALHMALAPVLEEPVPARLSLRTMAYPVRMPVWRRPVLALAASVVLMIGSGGAGWLLREWTLPPRHGIRALGQEAAASYAVYALDPIHPIEVSANDQDSFDQWATARLGRKVHAPDLNASGFHLMGGRLVATPHGPAAMFLYDGIHGLRVALVIRPMEVDQTAPMKPFRAEQANGYSWARDGLGFSIVGPAKGQNLHSLANEARRQWELS